MIRSVGVSCLLFALLGLCSFLTWTAAGEWLPIEDSAPLELSGQTLDGRPWHLNDQRGRVVLVNFWAGWCSPCLEEMPGLSRLNARMRDRAFSMVGVNVGEPELHVRILVRQLGVGMPILLDPESSTFTRWGATILPTTYVLDGDGRQRLVGQGPLDWDDPKILGSIERLIPKHSH
jgi:thiol-disulfide isomerase/thioredoxin